MVRKMSSRKFEQRLAKRVCTITLSSNAQWVEGVALKKSWHIPIFSAVIIISTVPTVGWFGLFGPLLNWWRCHILNLILLWRPKARETTISEISDLGAKLMTQSISGEGLSDSQGIRLHNVEHHWSTGQINIVTLMTSITHEECNWGAWQALVHAILEERILEQEAFPSPGDLPNPGIEPGFPAL